MNLVRVLEILPEATRPHTVAVFCGFGKPPTPAVLFLSPKYWHKTEGSFLRR